MGKPLCAIDLTEAGRVSWVTATRAAVGIKRVKRNTTFHWQMGDALWDAGRVIGRKPRVEGVR